MRRVSKRQRWIAALRNLLLGTLLGILQLLVLGTLLFGWLWTFPWWLSLGVGALFYLFIPAIASFFTAQQRGDANTGVGAGCLVGFVSAIVLLIIYSILATLQANAAPRDTFSEQHNTGALLGFIVVFEMLGGPVFTILGSSAGEALGLNHFLVRYQRQSHVEKKPS